MGLGANLFNYLMTHILDIVIYIAIIYGFYSLFKWIIKKKLKGGKPKNGRTRNTDN